MLALAEASAVGSTLVRAALFAWRAVAGSVGFASDTAIDGAVAVPMVSVVPGLSFM